MNSKEALKKLSDGNKRYVDGNKNSIDISSELREKLYKEGQKPFAVVICCSDSRVVPEQIFDVGAGEIFVIRLAGNVISDEALGSIEYAVDHLDCNTVVVLGHDRCGAVHAALSGVYIGHVGSLTKAIKKAVGEETDELKCTELNVKYGVKKIQKELSVKETPTVVGAVYFLNTGKVEFI